MSVLRHERPAATTPRGFRATPERPLRLLGSCPAYRPTALAALDALARAEGVAAVRVKIEAERMGLGSFKALGGAFAVAQMVREAGGCDDPAAAPARAAAARMTFVTASAGNHGLSVAAGARIFGARAVVVLPAAAPDAFARRIAAMGARVIRGGSYAGCVAEAMRLAEAEGWLHLADGAWPGYTDRPALVMEGYTVLAEECRAAFAACGDWPDHVVLQAGVGGLAAAVAAHVREAWAVQPTIVVVEPDRAPCLMESIAAGRPVTVGGGDSVMARLDCKEPSLLAFEALRRDADVFVTVTDDEARDAAATLGRHGIATTPSGAAGLAGLRALRPGRAARCLIVASEGPEAGS